MAISFTIELWLKPILVVKSLLDVLGVVSIKTFHISLIVVSIDLFLIYFTFIVHWNLFWIAMTSPTESFSSCYTLQCMKSTKNERETSQWRLLWEKCEKFWFSKRLQCQSSQLLVVNCFQLILKYNRNNFIRNQAYENWLSWLHLSQGWPNPCPGTKKCLPRHFHLSISIFFK